MRYTGDAAVEYRVQYLQSSGGPPGEAVRVAGERTSMGGRRRATGEARAGAHRCRGSVYHDGNPRKEVHYYTDVLATSDLLCHIHRQGRHRLATCPIPGMGMNGGDPAPDDRRREPFCKRVRRYPACTLIFAAASPAANNRTVDACGSSRHARLLTTCHPRCGSWRKGIRVE